LTAYQWRRAGAIGGKLLGAGGGGFMLLFARPQDQPKIREKLKKLLLVPFRFESSGSQIIFMQNLREKSLAWKKQPTS
jgi:D-glycero-alpha-D-manno-heptose-7-phosphate kinase